MNYKNLIETTKTIAIVALVSAGLAFAAGVHYQSRKNAQVLDQIKAVSQIQVSKN